MAAVPSAWAQVRVNLAWDANADSFTAGYRVFVGVVPGAPLTHLDVGRATSASLPLPTGHLYYLSVRAYTTDGVMGPSSPEAAVDLSAAPGAPTNAGASINGPNAHLAWAAPVSGGAPLGYFLSVGTAPGASNLLNGQALGGRTSTSGDLPPGRYFARVHAANLVGVGPPSREIAFEIYGGYRPLGPSGLAAAWVGANAVLTWARPSGSASDVPTSYIIEAGSTPGASNLGRFDVGNTSTVSVGVPDGTYYLRVRGVSARGTSDASNEVVLQARGAPGTPRSLVATGTGSTVSLRWSAPTSGGPATGYVVEVGSSPGLSNLAVAAVGNTTSIAAPAPPGTYYVRVRAMNALGLGAPSNEVVVRR